MITGKRLDEGKELTMYENINSFLSPKYIYIPLASGNDKDITILTKKGDYVYKGSIIAKSKGNFRIPIHSSVSGIVKDIVEKYYLDGEICKYIKIENDFKEQTVASKKVKDKISHYSKEEFIKILQNCGIIGMGGAGFPTYVKYNTNRKINTLIVNAVECGPYVTADYVLMKEKTEEILESIDAVMEINEIKEAIIAIKKTNPSLIEHFKNYLGTYPKIKVIGVSDYYPIGWERLLINKLKKVDYHLLPLEKGIVVNNVSTMYAIYEALKFNRPIFERVVTFTGENLNNPQNMLVRIGTDINDIINHLGGPKNTKNFSIIAGNPMTGFDIPNGDFAITANLNCVLVLNEQKNYEISKCMRCGKCTDICPVHISPVLIKDNLSNEKKLKSLKPKRCIECGLCSYICPSKLNIRESVVMAKHKVYEKGKKK